MRDAVKHARAFADAGYHKQVANRLLYPFQHITTILTTTELDNFFALRKHEMADPTFEALAIAMWDAYRTTDPLLKKPGKWHLPYVSDEEIVAITQEMMAEDDNWTPVRDGELFDIVLKLSAARCARVSYLNHDGTDPDRAKDIALAERLLEGRHMSPFEHQARPADYVRLWGREEYREHDLWGNFFAWVQYRKTIENEAGGTRYASHYRQS